MEMQRGYTLSWRKCPYAVAMETVHLAPNAQVSLYLWKDTPDKIPLAVRHIRTFLRAHQPVTITH